MKQSTAIATLAVSLMICGIVSAADAHANDYWTTERRTACPQNYRTPISLGGTTYYIDYRTITTLEVAETAELIESCPTEPVIAKRVYFYHGYKELQTLYKQYETPLTLLDLKTGPESAIWRLPFPEFTEGRSEIPGGFVEDVSDRVVLDRRSIIRARAYLFQHSNAAGRSDPFLVECGGTQETGAKRRDCEAVYFLELGIILRYSIRQDRRDHPAKHWEIPPAGPIPEPDGLLEVDRRIRNLIGYFTTQP